MNITESQFCLIISLTVILQIRTRVWIRWDYDTDIDSEKAAAISILRHALFAFRPGPHQLGLHLSLRGGKMGDWIFSAQFTEQLQCSLSDPHTVAGQVTPNYCACSPPPPPTVEVNHLVMLNRTIDFIQD